MKAKTFENLSRKIVREEIDYSLRREIKSLKEDITKEYQQLITENQNDFSKIKNTNTSLKEEVINNVIEKPHRKLNFTSNTALNDLLNETAQGSTNLNGRASPVSIDEGFTNIGEMPIEAVSKPVADAVTRDYSSLMKAIDKKRNK